MDRGKYLQYLRETSDVVTPVILKTVDECPGLTPDLRARVMRVLGTRLGKPLLKPALLRAAFEATGGADWHSVVPACAAFEMLNVSSYQANAAFDHKLGVLDENAKTGQYMAAMITRELGSNLLSSLAATFSPSIIVDLEGKLSSANRYIYLAQHFDMNRLIVDRLNEYSDAQVFATEYRTRCMFGSGMFTGYCAAAGGCLAGAPTDQLDALFRFGLEYGTALHRVNDLGDYAPLLETSGIVEFGLHDFFNGRLTAPLYELLTLPCQAVRDEVTWLMSRSLSVAETRDILSGHIVRNNVYDIIRASIKNSASVAKASLSRLPESTWRGLLAAMNSACLANKFFFAFDTMKRGDC